MADISVRDLRNKGGRVLQRVARGESLRVTIDGKPVAELRPLPGKSVPARVLLERWHGLPALDGKALRRDIDRVLDSPL